MGVTALSTQQAAAAHQPEDLGIGLVNASTVPSTANFVSASHAAAFLFQFGTGAIRGFAVTLFLGLMSNLFTSIFVSKTLFEFELANRKVPALSI